MQGRILMFSSEVNSVLFFAAAFTAVVPNSSAQQAVRPTTLEETIRASRAIFVGRVTEVRSRWGTPARRWIATDVTFLVEDALLADGSLKKGRTVVLTYPGGTVDGETQRIPGQVVPEKGKRYAMMLGADYDRAGNHPEAGGNGQGLFLLSQKKSGAPTVVHDATGAPLFRVSDGRIVRTFEALPADRVGPPVTLELFAQWIRQNVSQRRPPSGGAHARPGAISPR